MTRRQGGLTLLLIKDGAEKPRELRITPRWLRVLRWLVPAACGSLLVMAGSWFWLASEAVRARRMDDQVAVLSAERTRILALVEQLNRVEAQYDNLRRLFGSDIEPGASDLWLPPPGGRRSRNSPEGQQAIPDSWPLTARGFVTQGLLDGGGGDHPGLDIAIPSDSYIRAAGGGVVSEVGEDPTYGFFVRIDHGNGYGTLYAHASLTLVEVGSPIEKNEVIALSGSTGRSTAPHLHFEVTLNGAPVDPLTLIVQP